jgi:hypothetical protein
MGGPVKSTKAYIRIDRLLVAAITLQNNSQDILPVLKIAPKRFIVRPVVYTEALE